MKYYCIMVLTGEEKKFKERALAALKEDFSTACFYCFERKMYTPNRGWYEGKLFPSYLFFGVEELTAEFFSILRSLKGFCKILPDSQNPRALQGQALDELKFLIRNGELLEVSKIRFLEGQQVKAITGPLMGYEGQILYINKKRKQITVRSFLTEDGKTFDLKYEQAELTSQE